MSAETGRTVDRFGVIRDEPDTTRMLAPVRCKWCGHVHDAANVTVIARYADCSVWKCPRCHVSLDDRPIGWGGSAIDLRRSGGG